VEEVTNIFLTIEQLYLLVFMVLYFGLVLGVRTLILYLRTGISPWQKFGKKSGHQLAERLIPLAVLLLFIIIGNFFFLEENIKYLLPFEFLDHLWLKHLGLLFTVVGLMTTFFAQLQMKDSWRIGLDQDNEIKLVDKGMFAYSRNPIYVALMTAYTGVFFIVPSLISLFFLVIMGIAIHLKVKDEEKFLEKKLGLTYMEYKNRVRRWI
jgi:protein-S-isoprenylcysteine O-methyltransferase Ste14